MPDIFISYSRDERETTQRLAAFLERYALSVWYDVDLRAGQIFADAIEENLAAARCVIVLWTRAALRKGPKGWVYSEADWARQHGKLLQGCIEEVTLHPPFFDSQNPPVDLSALKEIGVIDQKRARNLLRRIGNLTGRPGLRNFEQATNSDSSLLAWAKDNPSDPLLKQYQARFDLARMRTTRRRGLEEELRTLAEDTLTAAPTQLKLRPLVGYIELSHVRPWTIDPPGGAWDLFDTSAIRVALCSGEEEQCGQLGCIAVVAAGRLFLVGAPKGSAIGLGRLKISLGKLEVMLLTDARPEQTSELAEVFKAFDLESFGDLLPVYGPDGTQALVDCVNHDCGFSGLDRGLQAWGPAPEPGNSVIVFEAPGLVVSSFTTPLDHVEGRVGGYRFDFADRSVVIASNHEAKGSAAAANADIVISVQNSEVGTVEGAQGPLIAPAGTIFELPANCLEVRLREL